MKHFLSILTSSLFIFILFNTQVNAADGNNSDFNPNNDCFGSGTHTVENPGSTVVYQCICNGWRIKSVKQYAELCDKTTTIFSRENTYRTGYNVLYNMCYYSLSNRKGTDTTSVQSIVAPCSQSGCSWTYSDKCIVYNNFTADVNHTFHSSERERITREIRRRRELRKEGETDFPYAVYSLASRQVGGTCKIKQPDYKYCNYEGDEYAWVKSLNIIDDECTVEPMQDF